MPSTNKEYWTKKFQQTIERDKKEQRVLKNLNWQVIVIWECELNNKDTLDDIIMKISHANL